MRAPKAERAVLDIDDDEVKCTRASSTRVCLHRSAGLTAKDADTEPPRSRGWAGNAAEPRPRRAPGAPRSPQGRPIPPQRPRSALGTGSSRRAGSALTWEWSFRHFSAARSQPSRPQPCQVLARWALRHPALRCPIGFQAETPRRPLACGAERRGRETTTPPPPPGAARPPLKAQPPSLKAQ